VGEEEAAKQVQLVEQVVSQQEALEPALLQVVLSPLEAQVAMQALSIQAGMVHKITLPAGVVDTMAVAELAKIITAVAVHLFTQT
jgi:hypothetical protein